MTDNRKFSDGEPGIGLAAARWLSEPKSALVGPTTGRSRRCRRKILIGRSRSTNGSSSATASTCWRTSTWRRWRRTTSMRSLSCSPAPAEGGDRVAGESDLPLETVRVSGQKSVAVVFPGAKEAGASYGWSRRGGQAPPRHDSPVMDHSPRTMAMIKPIPTGVDYLLLDRRTRSL